jgi:hypothetical protein
VPHCFRSSNSSLPASHTPAAEFQNLARLVFTFERTLDYDVFFLQAVCRGLVFCPRQRGLTQRFHSTSTLCLPWAILSRAMQCNWMLRALPLVSQVRPAQRQLGLPSQLGSCTLNTRRWNQHDSPVVCPNVPRSCSPSTECRHHVRQAHTVLTYTAKLYILPVTTTLNHNDAYQLYFCISHSPIGSNTLTQQERPLHCPTECENVLACTYSILASRFCDPCLPSRTAVPCDLPIRALFDCLLLSIAHSPNHFCGMYGVQILPP